MLKIIFYSFVVLFIISCSDKEVVIKSSLSTISYDDHYLYATGYGIDARNAKAVAIVQMRNNLIKELSTKFKNPKHPLFKDNKVFLNVVLNASKKLCNTLSMRYVQVDKTITKGSKVYVSIRLSKKALLDMLALKGDDKYKNVKEKYNSSKNDIAIKRYIVLKSLISSYPSLASIVQLHDNLTYSKSEDKFILLNNVVSDFKKIKSRISFRILTDVNSRGFSTSIKKAILKEGFSISKNPISDDSVKLIVTSKTDDMQDYQFLKSKTLIKLNLYDTKNNTISFRQHTFIGISSKNYKDAKAQAVINSKSFIKQMGIFDYIGFKKDS